MKHHGIYLKPDYRTVQVSYGTMPWGFVIKSALTYMFQPILLPVMIVASKVTGRTIKV